MRWACEGVVGWWLVGCVGCCWMTGRCETVWKIGMGLNTRKRRQVRSIQMSDVDEVAISVGIC